MSLPNKDSQDSPAGPEKAMSTEVETAREVEVLDAETSQKLLKRIDRRVMPVVSSYYFLRDALLSYSNPNLHVFNNFCLSSSASPTLFSTTTKPCLAKLPSSDFATTWTLWMAFDTHGPLSSSILGTWQELIQFPSLPRGIQPALSSPRSHSPGPLSSSALQHARLIRVS